MSATAPIRVVVIDDQELFVHGIRMLLESQPDLLVVGTASDGAAGVDLVAARSPDVVLMDIRMPVLDGLAATRRITGGEGSDRVGAPQVVVLTTFRQEEAVFRSMQEGASAFLTKDATPEQLLATVRSVHAGDAPPVSVDPIVRRFARPEGARRPDEVLAVLSPREREIYALVAKGLGNAEISQGAFISEATVKTHVRSILAKLELRSRIQIVVHAYENRLV
ncbi:two component transcriptional regulator, LuxR family [Rathayibacter oskolensis]|uniref:Two component transcriptional regulator, LuxR family n=1 Tax=Rathayibacter oskolensis TaxID=1891671 RepID=A0A1X7MYG9_9MICO|nr:response regulator transcription factor [Rathayibacter oskolensis]SMH29533.1 two component transcriptional regulator, LuxR family [Rathayibacter oskolensis]